MNQSAITAGVMARAGFSDSVRAAQRAAELFARHPHSQARLAQLAQTADPDLCLLMLGDLEEAAGELMGLVWADEGWLARLMAVLGSSQALGRHLVTRPADLSILAGPPRPAEPGEIRERVLAAVAGPQAGSIDWQHAAVVDPGAADRLRLANRAEVLRIAAADLTASDPRLIVDRVGRELADLADAVMTAALAIARAQVPGSAGVDIGVIAMGKCGARELNYISDIDVIWVAEPADESTSVDAAMMLGTRVVSAAVRICSAHTGTGSIWQVDSALRPEGNAGPLVRTLDSMAVYYRRWARNWEFQALLKARPMAGDLNLARAFCELVHPLVWQVGEAEHFVSDSQAMRQRVISLIPVAHAEREIKLGAGGLRDVEFSVQLLQLVHGRVDERLRLSGTLESLTALTEYGYMGRADGAELDAAYRFQRCLEHRVQLFRMRRTHLLPDDPAELRRLARSLGMIDGEELWRRWRASTVRVRRLQQRVFYSPLLEMVSRIPSEQLRLTPEQANAWLHGLGFLDPGAALRHIEALTQGMTRSADIQRQLMPAMLSWFAQGPNPDLGLLAFRHLSESMGSTAWYLRALRDQGQTAERLAWILSSSRYIGEVLRRDPPSVQFLTDDDLLRPRPSAELQAMMAQVIDRHEEPEPAITSVRALRRRELFRLAVADITGLIDLDVLGAGLSDLIGATVQAALATAADQVGQSPPIGVIAMGRWGGGEASYSSDADAMFIVPDETDAEGLARATRVVSLARELLRRPGPDPVLEVDADLRPEGRDGALVRTVSSYLSYYRRWSAAWERQALVRARHGCGDSGLTGQFLAGVADLRWPSGGVGSEVVSEIRLVKGRVDKERIPKGTDPNRNVKLGPGGLADVEWTVQLLQLRHAGQHPQLRGTGTMDALAAAVGLGLVSSADAEVLTRAWRLASRIRNATMLVRGRASDALPVDARDLAAVAMLLGRPRNQASALREDWARAGRRAAQVVERVFWR